MDVTHMDRALAGVRSVVESVKNADVMTIVTYHTVAITSLYRRFSLSHSIKYRVDTPPSDVQAGDMTTIYSSVSTMSAVRIISAADVLIYHVLSGVYPLTGVDRASSVDTLSDTLMSMSEWVSSGSHAASDKAQTSRDHLHINCPPHSNPLILLPWSGLDIAPQSVQTH